MKIFGKMFYESVDEWIIRQLDDPDVSHAPIQPFFGLTQPCPMRAARSSSRDSGISIAPVSAT